MCKDCRVPYAEAIKKGLVEEKLQKRIEEALGDRAKDLFFSGGGCPSCGDGKGYTGRTVVSEIISPDDMFMDLMKHDKLIEAKEYWVKELNGMTMMTHGLLKALSGRYLPQK